MRQTALVLPGRPGQTVSYERSTGLHELLERLANGMKVQSIALSCSAGGGVGKMMTPVVRWYEHQFTIRGELTSKPGEKVTFRCWRDGRVPKHQELTTISVVKVTF